MSIMETNPKAQQHSEHPIAVLYQRSVLDPMVETARAISQDSVRRPRHYRAVPENVAGILEGFRIRTGSNPEWPSAAQRAQLYAGIFDDTFRSTSMDLRYAVVAFTEHATETSSDPLEDRVRDAAIAFRGSLNAVEERAVSLADSETGPVFRSAIEVFRNREVTGAFGLQPAPGRSWPFDGALEADGASTDSAFLIEEIQRALGFQPTITESLFIILQRVAYYGAMTIAGVLDDATDWNTADWVRALVRNAYGWEKALESSLPYIEDRGKNLQPRVVSRFALDDEALRSLPTEEEAKRSGVQLAQNGGGGGGGGPQHTCTYGWTRICDNPGPGQSCTYGWTWYCDTGPTCTSGWTLVCDTGPTCTYGWTLKCDKPGL